jgi:hypothetical protein
MYPHTPYARFGQALSPLWARPREFIVTTSPRRTGLNVYDLKRRVIGFAPHGTVVRHTGAAGAIGPIHYQGWDVIQVSIPSSGMTGFVIRSEPTGEINLTPRLGALGARDRRASGPGAGGQDLCAAYENSVRLGLPAAVQIALLARCRTQNPNYVQPGVPGALGPLPPGPVFGRYPHRY